MDQLGRLGAVTNPPCFVGKLFTALASANAAAASYDSFDDRYLGPKSTAPTVDNDGNALLVGALYWNTGISALYVYDGANWNFYGAADPAGTGVAMAIALG